MANEIDSITQNLHSYLGESESELSLNIKKLTTNAKFVFSTLFLAGECQEALSIDRILRIFIVLGETLHIKVTKDILKNLGKIFNALNGNEILINPFFKNLRIHMKRLFPDYFSPAPKETYDNVEMHENLLLNSQTFKNFIDEDEERGLAYTSFTIRTMYSRAKSGRPMTGKVNNDNNDNFNNLDDIPETKNDMIGDKDGLLDNQKNAKKTQVREVKQPIEEKPLEEKRGYEDDDKKVVTGVTGEGKDLSTGEQQNVEGSSLDRQKTENINQDLESKELESPDNVRQESEQISQPKYNESDNVMNSHEIRSGTNIMDSEKLAEEDIVNMEMEGEKHPTDEKIIQPTEDTVNFLLRSIG